MGRPVREMLRAMGFEQDELITSQSVIFAVRSVKVDYLKPARFNELLNVSARLSLVKTASLIFEQSYSPGMRPAKKATIRIPVVGIHCVLDIFQMF
ncbi:MAG: hypothetical protein H0A75_01740 [Candidatus Methanofishera endochildressiae]|uniref:Thioesterase domain-containing protein n=1 Tax=Candidatus Methanofishera endochildressiae TaxID=2738884 RepID=A0A7Z0MNA4_9GAMM|nr:hypothetical protein [Candidatus Methanofishera endochildressiae]